MTTAKRILIVDDDPDIRDMLMQTLDVLGHAVEQAEDGQMALDRLRQNLQVDLVLSDIRMPKMDGMQLLQQCTKLYPGLPVALMSGHADLTVAIEAVKNAAFDFITKPFGIELLEELLTRLPDTAEPALFTDEASTICLQAETSLSLLSSRRAIRTATDYLRRQLATHCRSLGLSLDNVMLCLHEALNNAVIHGNLGVDSTLKDGPGGWASFTAAIAEREADPERHDRTVAVRCRATAAGLHISIADEGPGFDYQKPLPTDPLALLSFGRGLMLMRELSTEVGFEHPGSHVWMRFSRTG